jgi:hypothetical protein
MHAQRAAVPELNRTREITKPVIFTRNSYYGEASARKLLSYLQLPFEARHAMDYQNME